jgi:hypothetical protein
MERKIEEWKREEGRREEASRREGHLQGLAKVVRLCSLRHRVKFKISCTLSGTMSCLQGTLSQNRESLGLWGDPKCVVPSA